MQHRRKMEPGDWFNATAFLAIGLLLGLALATIGACGAFAAIMGRR